jgi:hypothetical protein
MASFGTGVTTRNETIAGIAGEAITAGNSIYRKGGKWYKARSNSLTTIGAVGAVNGSLAVAMNSALVANAPIDILISGLLENCTSLHVGGIYCVSDSVAGDVVLASVLTSGADYVVVMGGARSATSADIAPFSTAALATANNGTAGTGTTALHYGDGVNVTAVLTLTNVALTVGSSENLAVGVLIYTLPAGDLTVEHALMSLAISGVSATGDTPDVGLGTTIGSGAVAVLGGTPAFENIITGQTAADTNGTATTADQASALSIATGGNHTVYFNAADGWGANADADGVVNGTVIIKYRYNGA